jgi:hypothetical protein
MTRAWRDTKTGEFVDEDTYLKSTRRGGTRYEEVEVSESGDVIPDRIFGSVDDFYEYADWDGEYEEYFFDGGGDYGEE